MKLHRILSLQPQKYSLQLLAGLLSFLVRGPGLHPPTAWEEQALHAAIPTTPALLNFKQ